MKDLSKFAGTLTQCVESLIGSMGSMELNEIKSSFLSIINSPDVKASPTTRAYWIDAINRTNNKQAAMRTITNAYLAGAGLRVS